MSGVEVVGLVLAVIPLIISGLEHYAEGVRTIKVTRFAAREFRTVARDLEVQNIIFRNTLRILLQDCVDLRTQKELLEDIEGKAWQDANVEHALRERLQSSYSSYIDHVAHMQKTLAKLVQKLDIDAAGKVPFDNASWLKQICSRVRFALEKGGYLEQLKDIKDANLHLSTLTDQSAMLRTGGRVKKVPDFDKIRSSAAVVFDTLRRVLFGSCGSSHKASLCPKYISDETGDNFRVLLHHVGARSTPASVWSMAETEIKLIASTVNTEHVVESLQVVSIGRSSVARRSVRFQERITQVTAGASRSHSQAATDRQEQQVHDEIRDLCERLQSTLPTRQCGQRLGSITLGTRLHHCEISVPREQLLAGTVAVGSVHSLDAVLRGRYNIGLGMTNADALRLAVSLSTGMLQLHDTPWLRDRWNKGDISIIERNGKFKASHPLWSCGLEARAGQADEGGPPTSKSPVRNPTLLSLGIILIELCMRQSIDKLHTLNELDEQGQPNELSAYWTARRLVDKEEISERFGRRYSDVVHRCILCSHSQAPPLLSNATFRADAYHDIVRELSEGLREFLGEKFL